MLTIQDLSIIATGHDYVAGEDISRWWGVAAIALPFVNGGMLRGAVKGGGKLVDEGFDVFSRRWSNGGVKENELFLPDEFYNKKLPRFVEPGIKRLPKYDEYGNLKQIKYYDDYEREKGWVDLTDHLRPATHTSPHWHEVQWNSQYPIGGYKIDHRMDPNPPFDFK